jgi:hypothetical protein
MDPSLKPILHCGTGAIPRERVGGRGRQRGLTEKSARRVTERRSARRQLARVSNFGTGNGPHLRHLDGSHGSGVPVERCELDLERLAVLEDVNDGSDITDL